MSYSDRGRVESLLNTINKPSFRCPQLFWNQKLFWKQKDEWKKTLSTQTQQGFSLCPGDTFYLFPEQFHHHYLQVADVMSDTTIVFLLQSSSFSLQSLLINIYYSLQHLKAK